MSVEVPNSESKDNETPILAVSFKQLLGNYNGRDLERARLDNQVSNGKNPQGTFNIRLVITTLQYHIWAVTPNIHRYESLLL